MAGFVALRLRRFRWWQAADGLPQRVALPELANFAVERAV